MNLAITQCCAFVEITNLSSDENATESMLKLCKMSFNVQQRFHNTQARANSLYSFYVFTAAVTHSGQPHGWQSANRLYGTDFMNFIKEHNLGEVWESPIVKNVAFHSGNSNKIWVWMPDAKALRAWYDSFTKEFK